MRQPPWFSVTALPAALVAFGSACAAVNVVPLGVEATYRFAWLKEASATPEIVTLLPTRKRWFAVVVNVEIPPLRTAVTMGDFELVATASPSSSATCVGISAAHRR